MPSDDLAKIEEGLQRSNAFGAKVQTDTEQRKGITSANSGHATAHYPYFSYLLTIILVLSFVISTSVHGAETLSVNPLGGMGWSGLQKSGACWPADLHDGHVYLPFTALVV